MKLRLALTGLLWFLAVSGAQAASPIDPAKEADIRRLIEVTGGEKMLDQLKGAIFGQLKQMMLARLPEGEAGERGRQMVNTFHEKFSARFDAEQLLERLVPIYDKYLTHEDIKGLIAFYESPLGQRLLAVLPDVTQESFAMGAAWGREIAQEVMREMAEDFPELKGIKP